MTTNPVHMYLSHTRSDHFSLVIYSLCYLLIPPFLASDPTCITRKLFLVFLLQKYYHLYLLDSVYTIELIDRLLSEKWQGPDA